MTITAMTDVERARRLTIPQDRQRLYWIARSPAKHDVVHYGVTERGQETVTGQSELKEYATQSGWLAALKKLGIDPTKEDDAWAII
jgi:hypothetical protein